eukprot:70526-Pleurochrysis_carterae.AAC.1
MTNVWMEGLMLPLLLEESTPRSASSARSSWAFRPATDFEGRERQLLSLTVPPPPPLPSPTAPLPLPPPPPLPPQPVFNHSLELTAGACPKRHENAARRAELPLGTDRIERSNHQNAFRN